MVLLLDVIEHLHNPGTALRHIAEVTAGNGYLLVTTPNPRWGRSRIHAFHSGFLACFTQDDLDLNNHLFPVWPHVLVNLLELYGFEIEQYVLLDGPTCWPDFSLSLRYPLQVAHAALNKILEWHDPTACGMSYAVLARRKVTNNR